MTVGTGVMALSLQKRELIFSRKDIYSLLFLLFWSVNHIRKFTKSMEKLSFRCLVKCFISSTEIEWHANCFVNSLNGNEELHVAPIELCPDPPARLSEEELLFSKQKLQKLKIFARLELLSLQMRHYRNWRFQHKENLFWFLNFWNRA